MIEECLTCRFRHKTPNGANWCDELDMRLHPNPAHGRCILKQDVEPSNLENNGR